MDTIFKFLKEYNMTAYKMARNMERTLNTEPLGALTFGGRFLESIVNSLYQEHYKQVNKSFKRNVGEDIKINKGPFKKEDFAYKTSKLQNDQVLKSYESRKLRHAYNIRNNLHLNEDIDDIESDKKASRELFKEVFEISLMFCKKINPGFNEEAHEFKYPTKTIEKTIPNVNIAKIFDDCVICGKYNISPHRNICPECYRKIRLGSDLDDLIDLLNNDNRFTKEFLKKQSYDTYEIEYMLHFLREFDLRSSETKEEYFLRLNESYDFIEETKSYEEIEKILLAFYNELIDAGEIDYSEDSYYRLGESGDDTYSQFYLLVITKKIKHYLNLKSKNIPNACRKSRVNIDEISNWYDRKVRNILKLNYKKDLDISFNQMSRILMDKWIEYRENNEKKEDIKSKLKLSDVVLGFWLDESLIGNTKYPYITEFIYKNRELEMKLFVEGLSLGLNKQDAIEFADTSSEFVDKFFNLNNEETLIKRWRIGKQENNEESFKRYKNVYFHKKTKEFLEYLKGDEIDSALMESDLDKEDFNNWYDAGKREFFKYNCDLDSDLFKFYIKTTRALMDNWLNERKEGYKKLESCKNIGLYSDTLDEWFKFKDENFNDFDTNPKYKTFRDFYSENHNLEMELVIESIEDGNTAIRAAKNADVSKEKIDEYYRLGKEGKEEYIDFYNKYEEIYLPLRREEFISLFKKKEDFTKALKASELDLDYIESAYEDGKNGSEDLCGFYEDLLDVKLRVYAKKLSLNEKEKRAKEKAHLTNEEIEKYDYRIEILALANNMGRILDSPIDKKLERTVDKSSIELKDVFNWYEAGKTLFDEDENLEYLLDDEILEKYGNSPFDFILKDKDYKENTEKNFDSYYKNFFNLFEEFYITVITVILSRFLYEDKKINTVLKSTKTSKKEFKYFDELGLIKREEDAEKLINEMDYAEKAIQYYKEKKWEESLEYFKKAFDEYPTHREHLLKQAECLEKMEEYEEAIKCYDKLINMRNYFFKYWYDRAVLLKKLDKYEDALESCKEADKLDSDNELYLSFIASTLISMGNIDEALETLNSTEKTLNIEISADELESIKEIVENPLYKNNIGNIKISKDLDKYFEEEDLNALIFEVDEVDDILESLKTGVLPECEEE